MHRLAAEGRGVAPAVQSAQRAAPLPPGGD